MKFDPLVKFSEVVKNALTTVWRGSDGRYYVGDNDTPDRWSMSTHSFTDAMRSVNFTQEFWQEKMNPALRDDPRTVRVKGTHYRIGDENADRRGFRGFGGSLFLVEFHDGRRVASTNMWCQGLIPVALRHLLPDNAVFITPEPGLHIEMWLQGGVNVADTP